MDATYPSDVAFTPTVKAIQSAKGSRDAYARVEQRHGWETTATPRLAEFISELDMFYLGTANADGQPYIQYRGGSKGFLKVVDEQTLGFADFGGNQQFITLGNLSDNPQAFLFLIDYVNRRRIKVWGTARVVDDDPEFIAQLADDDYYARPERAILFTISAWDVNCPQHIHRRIPEADVASEIDRLQSRIRELQGEIETLRSTSS